MSIYQYDDKNERKAINLAAIVGIEYRSGNSAITILTQGEDKHLNYPDGEAAQKEYARMLQLMHHP